MRAGLSSGLIVGVASRPVLNIGERPSDPLLPGEQRPVRRDSGLGPDSHPRNASKASRPVGCPHDAPESVLTEWAAWLREEFGNPLPAGVTAFREGMAVHGHLGQASSGLRTSVQRVSRAEDEFIYCAPCLTPPPGGGSVHVPIAQKRTDQHSRRRRNAGTGCVSKIPDRRPGKTTTLVKTHYVATMSPGEPTSA